MTDFPLTPTGRLLNELWRVGARHALYHKDGVWFNHLVRFPGALFDPHGYVVFETSASYERCPRLRHGKELNVPAGIAAIPGYVKLR
jgi:hypothetical protein